MNAYEARTTPTKSKIINDFDAGYVTPRRRSLTEELEGLGANLSQGYYTDSNSPKSAPGTPYAFEKKDLEQVKSTQKTQETLSAENNPIEEITSFTVVDNSKTLTRFQRFFIAFNGLMNEMFKSLRTELGVQTLFAPFVICVLITPFAITKIIARVTGNDGIIDPANS